MTLVAIDSIRLDGGTQPRSTIFFDTVEEYVEGMGRGDIFPPLVTYYDGTDYWLADGFHRHHAARGLGLTAVECDVHQGTRRDAILFAVGANSQHGRPRTNDDKRRAVRLLLDDVEWSGWSDREIARRCRVDHKTVAALRAKPTTEGFPSEPEPRTYTNRHGGTSTMDVSNIGRRTPEPSGVGEAAAPTVDVSECKTTSDIAPRPPGRPSLIAELDPHWLANADHAEVLFEIEQAFAKLGSPEELARHFPQSFLHAFSAARARDIEQWFARFGREWARHHGAPRVAA